MKTKLTQDDKLWIGFDIGDMVMNMPTKEIGKVAGVDFEDGTIQIDYTNASDRVLIQNVRLEVTQ